MEESASWLDQLVLASGSQVEPCSQLSPNPVGCLYFLTLSNSMLKYSVAFGLMSSPIPCSP